MDFKRIIVEFSSSLPFSKTTQNVAQMVPPPLVLKSRKAKIDIIIIAFDHSFDVTKCQPGVRLRFPRTHTFDVT